VPKAPALDGGPGLMHPRPHPFFANMNVTLVACGEGFTVCTVESKLLYAWGANDHGQVGGPVWNLGAPFLG
jgi:alpha-tubulin suppressor-like RCC1 family protein